MAALGRVTLNTGGRNSRFDCIKLLCTQQNLLCSQINLSYAKFISSCAVIVCHFHKFICLFVCLI